jgi:hypothetical protein
MTGGNDGESSDLERLIVSRRTVVSGVLAGMAVAITGLGGASAAWAEPSWNYPLESRAFTPECGQFSLLPMPCRNGRIHEGHDFTGGGAYAGAPIHPVSTGMVIATGPSGEYGIRVEIDHGGGWRTIYAHMVQTPSVTVGQSVQAATVLGFVGKTGRATGEHLHVEMRGPQGLVDPYPLLANAPLPDLLEDDMFTDADRNLLLNVQNLLAVPQQGYGWPQVTANRAQEVINRLAVPNAGYDYLPAIANQLNAMQTQLNALQAKIDAL